MRSAFFLFQMLRSRFFLFCWLLAAGFTVQGQPAYTIQHFTNAEGLPSNTVKALVMDTASGMLWMGTEAGICSFDGQSLIAAPGVSGRVLQMGRAGGYIYAAIEDGARFYALAGGRPVLLGADSSVLLSKLYDRGLPTLQQLAAAIQSKPYRMIWPAFVLPLDRKKSTFLTHQRDSVYLLKNGQMKYIYCQPGLLPTFFSAPLGALVHYNNQLFRLEANQHLQLLSLPDSLEISSFILNTNTRFPLLVSRDKLYQMDIQGERLSCTLLAAGLPGHLNLISAWVAPDRSFIALGDAVKGLFLLRQALLSQTTDPRGLAPNRVFYGQTEIRPNQVLTQNGVLVDSNNQVIAHYPIILHAAAINQGGSASIWQADPTGIRHITNPEKQKAHSIRLPGGSPAYNLMPFNQQMYALATDNIYLLSDTGGRALLPPALARQYARFGGRFCWGFEWSPGIMAVVAGNNILLYRPAKQQLKQYQVPTKGPIRAIWRYRDYVFAGTYGDGIYAWHQGRLRRLPLDREGHLNYAHCFMPDSLGFVWISSNSGLFRVRINALCQAADGLDVPIYYHYLGSQEGLRVTELNGGCFPCALRLQDGKFSFPSLEGLVQFRPETVPTIPPDGQVLLDGFFRDSTRYGEGQHSLMQLPAGGNITMRIRIPYWGNEANIYAWYRLTGSTEGWKELHHAGPHEFNFPALPYGRYALEVKVLTGFEPGKARITSFPFEILPPWYLHPLALFAWTILLALLIAGAVRLRSARVQQQNKNLQRMVNIRTRALSLKQVQLTRQLEELQKNNTLRTRLISIISHNIITPLRYMHRAASSLNDERLNQHAALRRKATDSISHTAKELEQLSINMLNWIRAQHRQPDEAPVSFMLLHKVNAVVRMVAPLAREKGLQLEVLPQADFAINQYPDAIHTILYNLLINAINYSSSGRITVQAATLQRGFAITVADEGPGMSAAAVQKLMGQEQEQQAVHPLQNQGQGLGYLIIHDLLRITGGRILVDSQLGKGTRVRVTFDDLSHQETGG